MKDAKKETIKVAGLCFLGALMFGGAGAYLLFGNDSGTSRNEQILYAVLAGFLMMLCLATAISFICSYYKKHINPEDGKSDEDIRRESSIHQKLPGKDMYDVIRRYRKSNYRNRVLAIGFACVLIIALFLIKMSGEFDMDWRISVALGVLTIILAFVIAGRKEFSYSGELDFKKAIAKSGADPVRLNADFMMGSHFALPDGMVMLGRDYLVVFAKGLCEVADVSKITKISKDSFSSTINGTKITTHRIRIFMKNGGWLRFSLRDKTETDLLLNEFRLRGFGYEDEGEKSEKEIKEERKKRK
jgi:hypothetical protein